MSDQWSSKNKTNAKRNSEAPHIPYSDGIRCAHKYGVCAMLHSFHRMANDSTSSSFVIIGPKRASVHQENERKKKQITLWAWRRWYRWRWLSMVGGPVGNEIGIWCWRARHPFVRAYTFDCQPPADEKFFVRILKIIQFMIAEASKAEALKTHIGRFCKLGETMVTARN